MSPSDCPPLYWKAWHQYTDDDASPRRPDKQSNLLIDEDLPDGLADVIDQIDLTEPPNLYAPDLSQRNDPDQGETE